MSIVESAMKFGLNGLILTNTTISGSVDATATTGKGYTVTTTATTTTTTTSTTASTTPTTSGY